MESHFHCLQRGWKKIKETQFRYIVYNVIVFLLFFEEGEKNKQRKHNFIVYYTKNCIFLFLKGVQKNGNSILLYTIQGNWISICLFFFLCASHPQTSTITMSLIAIIVQPKQHPHQQIYAPQHHRTMGKSHKQSLGGLVLHTNGGEMMVWRAPCWLLHQGGHAHKFRV